MSRTHLAAAALAIALVSLFALVVRDSLQLVDRPFPGFMIWDNGMLVPFHDLGWTGVEAGLPTYGRVLTVDGSPFVDRASLMALVDTLPIGTSIAYEVLESGDTREISVPTMPFGIGGYLSTFAIYIGGAAICWLTALAVLYLKPSATGARVLAGMMFVVGFALLCAVDILGTSRFWEGLRITEALTPIAILHFVAVFPRARFRPESITRWATLGYILAAAFGLIGALYFFEAPEFSRRISDSTYIAMAVALLLAVIALASSVVREPSATDRVKAFIVFIGALAACIVPAIGLLAARLLGSGVSWSWIFAPVSFFPLAVLYAVARHDLLESERFIRLSLGYSVASAGATLIFALSLFALDVTVFPGARSSTGSAFLFVLVLAITFNPLLARTQHAIDRYFYRSALDPGRVLEELGADLAECSDEESIRGSVIARLGDSLNLEWVRLANGRADELEDPGELAVPVPFRSADSAVIVCGPKKSGAPFAETDKGLVGGAAAQAGVALRNVRSMVALQEAQERLVRQERLAAMGELAGSVAHGVRNPLAGIRASAQTASLLTMSDDVRETFSDIISESDRLERRVHALLDFSRPFQPNLVAVDVALVLEGVRRAIEPRAQRIGVDVAMTAPPELVLSASDPNFLEEALLELAGNALRGLDGSGGRFSITATRVSDKIMIDVADTGPGIPIEVQARVFDLFFTTRSDGTGMGLATVKRILEALGGSIAVASSSAAEGTVLSIELPVAGPTGS